MMVLIKSPKTLLNISEAKLTSYLSPHITYIADFIKESELLYEHILRTIEWDTRLSVRKTASFGVAYEYSGLTYPHTPLPIWSKDIIDAINDLLGFTPNNCLINYYENGKSSMGFHSDDTSQMQVGTGVVIISLGAERKITYRNKIDNNIEFEYLLASGSLLYMDEQVQQHWLHAIKKDNTTKPRMSLTFRQLL